jgi:hypothetical protein
MENESKQQQKINHHTFCFWYNLFNHRNNLVVICDFKYNVLKKTQKKTIFLVISTLGWVGKANFNYFNILALFGIKIVPKNC